MKQLNESLKHLDMEDQVIPTLGIDVYKSKIGYDNEIVTLDFTVKQKMVAEDLVEWLEKGYDWIIDCEPSPGEISNDRYLVFVEMNRRTNAAKRIVDMLADLETLTGLKSKDWRVKFSSGQGPATVDFINKHLVSDPNEYKAQHGEELNEMRLAAGLETKKLRAVGDDLKAWQRQAGII
jgi:hypothetical protein